MASPPSGLTTLLARLAASGTDFVLVGALAGVAQGAPLTTMDVDVVHRRDPANVDRLIAFLDGVDARYRGRPAGQVLRPVREALLGDGHHLLMTTLGPLDVLGAVEGGAAYEDLARDCVTVEVEGQPVKVASLRALVALKRGAVSAKGRLALAILEETLRRQGQD
ncbi:MAG: hypothetical protein WB493_05400 [Anaeromyxobacteraceae bacterium]